MRRWPDGNAYVEAVQNSANLGDGDLQRGSYELRQNGLPKPYSGGFTTTFHFTTGLGSYAVRCFTRGNDDLERRYQAITDFLRFVQHPAFCQAEYLPHGINVNAGWWPIIKMQWVAGRQLNAEVEASLQDVAGLQRLADSFRKLVGALGVLGVAHGDLQHGNIIVTNGELRLIDYDGIYLPALAGMLPSEYGHQNYQHPQRKDAPFDGRLDRFSSIVIYTALIALTHDHNLWRRFNNDENLLFRASDFTSHGRSDLLQALLSNPRSASLAQQLVAACSASVANVPTLEQTIAAASSLGAKPTNPTTSNPPYESFKTPPPILGAPPPISNVHATGSSTRSVPPQPFAMPTVRVESQSNVPVPALQPPRATLQQSQPAFCGHCGAALARTSGFCGHCGSANIAGSTQAGLPAPGTRFIGQWNWGSFFLYPLWLMTHRRVGLGLFAFVLYLIPGISLAAAAYFGRNGSRIAVLSGRFHNEPEFVAVQNAWRNWGWIFFFLVLGIGILSRLGNSPSYSAANQNRRSPNPPRIAAATPRHVQVVAATGSCESPNSADIAQMKDTISRFHQSVLQHRWAEAEQYDIPATYQSAESMQSGYATTIESIPTITAVNGCHINVTLKFQNADSPQYCIDQLYEMAYIRRRQPSWVIHSARSVSEKRLCS